MASSTGVRSLRRTLIYDQTPLGDLSVFVRSRLVDELDTGTVGAVYDPRNGQYLIYNGTESYYLDTKNPLETGAWRVSEWTLPINSADYNGDDGKTYLCIGGDLCEYTGYLDDDDTYQLRYRSSWLDFGSERIKIMKGISAVISDGATYTPRFIWSFDFDDRQEQGSVAGAIAEQQGSEYGQAEYGASGLVDKDDATKGGPAEYGSITAPLSEVYTSMYGTGEHVQIGMQVTINGSSFGLQQIKAKAKLGRLAT